MDYKSNSPFKNDLILLFIISAVPAFAIDYCLHNSEKSGISASVNLFSNKM